MKRKLTIAGGGLAGLSLAAGMRLQGVSVSVLEAAEYPRHRVCGEFISGVSQETLSVLGINDLFGDALQHRTVLWKQGGRVLHRNKLPDAALGISRYVLDQRLWERVLSLGGDVRTRTRARSTTDEGFVWAAGRRPKAGPWVGLKGHVMLDAMGADLEMHVGRNGYVGLAGVEEGWTNVCGLFRIDKRLEGKGPDLLSAYVAAGGHEELASHLRSSTWRDGSFAAVAGFEMGRQGETPGLCAVGDAESMIPPFTGNGMSMAFQAAESAVKPLTHWAEGDLAWSRAVHETRSVLRRRFARRLVMARLLHKFLLDPGGRTLLRSLATFHLLPFRSLMALVR